MNNILTAGLTVFFISACASTPKPAAPSPASKMQLSARTLNSGDCGLFVWTADASRRLVFFTRPSGQDAVWHDGQTEVPLKLSSLPPPQRQALPPKQSFMAGNTALSLDMRQPQLIPKGTRYKSGLLRLRPAAPGEAWERVVPVVGLAACQI